MKKLRNRNQFDKAVEGVWEVFDGHLAGNPTSLLCAVSLNALGEAGQGALTSSASALGLSADGCCFITLRDTADDAGVPLGSADLRMLIEACDPLVLVACDALAAKLLSQAYGVEVPTGRPCRVMGRTCVAFVSLEDLLQTPADKQKAWYLLKQLTA